VPSRCRASASITATYTATPRVTIDDERSCLHRHERTGGHGRGDEAGPLEAISASETDRLYAGVAPHPGAQEADAQRARSGRTFVLRRLHIKLPRADGR
jgi:hypothetical protein